MKNILLTGGAGYIGSHTFIELFQCGFRPIIYDNFSNSKIEVINRLSQICNSEIEYIKGDIRDQNQLEASIRDYNCEAIIHFAGLKAVGESVSNPDLYYSNNLTGTVCLLNAINNTGVTKLVFSSSATVYGKPIYLPIDEKHPLSATNPYGRTKLFIEEMLRDYANAFPKLKIAILRYFNPAGAHESGLIGEDPLGIPNNLMPYVSQVAAGLRTHVNVWGNDYETHDGTGVRDFIHVTDLAKGHIKALNKLDDLTSIAVNLGTGKGYSVMDIIKTFQEAAGTEIPYQFKDRRNGDVASCYANPSFANKIIGWKAERNLFEMCKDHWNWQKNNPNGY
ncbi:UDP-glucose 4-epimerase GalE [Methylophilus glucosoxydans]|uniref:UDP-glucose 4-epimerase n=1 Tax=Methylophilus glucosoxydans TaxID=752553 RepID=A0ABW3GKW9_9PROT